MRKLWLLASMLMLFSMMFAVPASADIPTDVVDQYWVWYPDHTPGANIPGYWVNPINHIGTPAPQWRDDGLRLDIFNIEIPENVKNIWVEVKYLFPQTEIAPITVIDPKGNVFDPVDAWISTNGQFVTWQWQLPWQPRMETIDFGNPSFFLLDNIELVEIATQCVPEPSSLFLLLPGVVGLGAFIRRKK